MAKTNSKGRTGMKNKTVRCFGPTSSKSTPEYVMGHLVTIYKMARDGCALELIIDACKVSHITFHKWKRLYPAVRDALDAGHRVEKQAEAGKFRDYIFDKLPPELQKLWKQLTSLDAEDDDSPKKRIAKIRAKLDDEGKLAKQQLFLYALVHSDYNPSKACKRVHINKKQLDKWIETSERFRKLLAEIDWHKKNFFEEAVVDLVKARDPGTVRFAAQSQLADRGYGNTKTIQKNVNVSGGLAHSHEIKPVDIKALGLDLEGLRKLREATRDSDKLPPRLVQTEDV